MTKLTVDTDISGEIIASLFPEQRERAEIFEFLKSVVDRYSNHIPSLKINPQMSKAEISEILSCYDFDSSQPSAVVLSDVLNMLEQGIVHVTSPNYFGLFNPSTSLWGCVADFITGLYNPQLAVWSHAPACVDIEEKLVHYLGQLAGFDAKTVGGSFTTGGAEANCTAMICALTQKVKGFAQHGLQIQAKRPVIYISADSHLAWLKIALQCGLGHDAVRLVDVDSAGKMDIVRLNAVLREDLENGFMPFMLVGTAGTTNAGSIDPLRELAVVAKEYDLYFHIDAAWAGAILLSEQHASLLTGIAEADSFTLDAHKWLTAPMGTGIFICADKGLLSEPFAVTTSYMPVGDSINKDPYLNSVQWSRRFNGLRLFLPLAILGRKGFSKMIDYQVELGDYLKMALEQNDWVVVNVTTLPVICFRDVLNGDVDLILEQVLTVNKVWLSSTVFAKNKVFRTCITSFRSVTADVDNLITALNNARSLVYRTAITPDQSTLEQ
ncbi:conserved hypothetical protein [Enterobacterales bacterium 8AC]|nr:conserved hypothetical protein [Enterobacterales bacterium 8AC]